MHENSKIRRFDRVRGYARKMRELELPEVIYRGGNSRRVVKLSLRLTYPAARRFQSRLIRNADRYCFFFLYTILPYIVMWVTIIRGFMNKNRRIASRSL